MKNSFIFSDLALSRRLERAEAKANAEFVEARAQLYPDSGAEWIEVAGAYAMFDGVDSPITQTFGLGLFENVGETELERIEAFFSSRNSPVFHEVSPLGDPALTSLLSKRGYQPLEYSSVLVLPLNDFQSFSSPEYKPTVRLIEEHEKKLWADVAAEGWSEFKEFGSFIRDISYIGAYRKGALLFIAELDARAIATGSLFINDRGSGSHQGESMTTVITMDEKA